jgi:ATP-dependent DNA helicase RecG
MDSIKKKEFLFQNVLEIKGVGKKLSLYLKNKKIEKVNDLIWNLPYSYTDRTGVVKLNQLEVGKIVTVKVKIIKYNFPRIRNLPNRVICSDETGNIDLIFFNSREGYVRKVLPINEWVVISGKVNFFKKKYQITNPAYIEKVENIDYVQKKIPKYSLTEGLTEKTYRKIIDQVMYSLPKINEWHDQSFVKKEKFLSWNESITMLHQEQANKDLNSIFVKRLAYDEIFANLLLLSNNRIKIKKIKKNTKYFKNLYSNNLIQNLPFKLTNSQNKVVAEIENDLRSTQRMYRILQGDVGSGKTIVAFISSLSVIESGYQCGMMAPTGILAQQHFELLSKLLLKTKLKIKIALLTGKTEPKHRKEILLGIKNKKIDFLIGTHALFQKKIDFNNLGLVVIDEQHKFGVKQRINFAKKGGENCDVLLMSATPIPRTMMMSIYGDMDTSKITEKPINRDLIKTLSKPENKIEEVWPFIERKIDQGEQIFWVCPLIEDSKKLDYSSTLKKFKIISKKFPKKVGFIHGALSSDEKEKALKQFLNKEILILVSTTVIEVGIDFPNATVIVIENANKFGLAQLHQLRGRVGRGKKSGTCILLFKNQLSQNARKRINILKKSNDGFYIAEEDMKLRGFGDIIGFKQSGIKYFKIADPIHHEYLFKMAEVNIKNMDEEMLNNTKFNLLLRLFDKVDLIDEEGTPS